MDVREDERPKGSHQAVGSKRILRYIPRLRRYAYALTGSKALADDLVQDTLVRALSKWALFQPRSKLRAWLFAIMHNLYLNQLAANRLDREALALDDALPLPAVTPVHDSVLLLHHVVRALQSIPPEQREVLLLVALEDMKYEDVARVLHVPIGTVMSRLSRGRQRLRSMLDA